MPTSTTSQSALKSGAAKDDALGADGTFTFSISDLLANDPGGAAKVSLATQFFFGDTAADQADQAGYLPAHGITDNGDGTYTLESNATDFNYFVQIGNKGTWSTAAVDVTAPLHAPSAGEVLFQENFDGYTNAPQFGVVDLGATPNAWINAGASELGQTGYGNIASTSGDYWLDTMNSPGPIDITSSFVDPTGGQAEVCVDIGTQALEYLGQPFATDPNGLIQFQVDDVVVAQFTAAEVQAAANGNNTLAHFDFLINTGAAGSSHTIEIVDASSQVGFTGFRWTAS